MSDIVWSINPAKDHLHDLSQRMRRFASDILTAKGIGFQFVSPPPEKDISINTNLRREVFLIFKEAVSNIVKHSGATRAKIEFSITDENLILRISDDGKGFEVSELPAKPGVFSDGGNGILNIRRRAREMNGDLNIVSEKGKNTSLVLCLPLDAATRTGGEFEPEKL
jgi:signal transduction histidine kinase